MALAGLVAGGPPALGEAPGSGETPAPRQVVDTQDTPIPAPSGPAGLLEDEEVDRNGGSGLSGFLQTLLALALVIALIFAVRFLLKRYGPSSPAGKADAMELLASRSVSPKNRLLLVRFGKRLLLLSSGPGGLSTLCETSDPQEAAAMLEGGERKTQ